ncbi:MAG: hypothetical protein H6719_00865 [Sandaracinaceae bacterium]|nr:hypothetical protein [Sandaracinaceae bacterium]
MRRITYLFLIVAGCTEPTVPNDAEAALPLPAEAPAPSVGAPSPVASTTPARPAPLEAAPARQRVEPPAPGRVVSIAGGPLHVGSRPGWVGRDPKVEADLAVVEVPAFDIDALPYPNDPARPAALAATRAEAAAMCASEGRRLCEELEWERACRGDGTDPFATGDRLDIAACVADPSACASSMGVFDMGFRAPEWTATDADEQLAHLERTAVARGGRPDFTEATHRCGSRLATNPQGGGRALAVRCCGGEAPSIAYPDVGRRRPFRDLEIDDGRWREILATVPEVARFAQTFVAYSEPAATRALARGGATPESVPWSVAPGPFAWSPSPGEEVWVVAGQSGDVSLLIALYPNPDETFHHAASFVIAEPEMPIAVLRTPTERGELLWTTCWSCGGENGAITFGEDSRILIAQR